MDFSFYKPYHICNLPPKVLQRGSLGGGRSAQEMHNSWQLFGPSLVWTDLERMVLTGWKCNVHSRVVGKGRHLQIRNDFGLQSTSNCYLAIISIFLGHSTKWSKLRLYDLNPFGLIAEWVCLAMLRLGRTGVSFLFQGLQDLGDFIDVVQQWVFMVFPLIYGNLGWWTYNSPEQVVTFFFLTPATECTALKRCVSNYRAYINKRIPDMGAVPSRGFQ